MPLKVAYAVIRSTNLFRNFYESKFNLFSMLSNAYLNRDGFNKNVCPAFDGDEEWASRFSSF